MTPLWTPAFPPSSVSPDKSGGGNGLGKAEGVRPHSNLPGFPYPPRRRTSARRDPYSPKAAVISPQPGKPNTAQSSATAASTPTANGFRSIVQRANTTPAAVAAMLNKRKATSNANADSRVGRGALSTGRGIRASQRYCRDS